MRFHTVGCLIIILLTLTSSLVTAQHQVETGMEGADVITIDEHFIILSQGQESPNEVYYEEHIVFKNTGSDNYSGKLYTWAPKNLESLYKPVITINETTIETDKLQPTLNFLFINLTEDEISIKPNETLKVVFKFNLNYLSTDNFTFERVFLYDNKNVIIMIEANIQYNVEGQEGLELIYIPESITYASPHNVEYTRTFGESMSIIFTRKPEEPDINNQPPGDTMNNESGRDSGYQNYQMIILILVTISIIVIVMIGLIAFYLSRKNNDPHHITRSDEWYNYNGSSTQNFPPQQQYSQQPYYDDYNQEPERPLQYPSKSNKRE